MSEILGAFFAVLLGLMFMPQIQNGIATQHQMQMDINTARQQQAWVDAVSNYVSGNMTTLEATAGPTTPVTISLATIQAAGIPLATGFNGTNPFNQTWTAQVKQPTAGNLQVFVYSTGGTVIKDQELGAIASAAGGIGGFIPSNNSGVYAGGASTAYGAYGSWTISTANYANIAGGHPASLLNFSNGTLTSNYLYRNAVPGQPQLNQMNTNLSMGNNNITAANQISTQSLQALSNGSMAVPSVTLANGKVVAFNQVGEGGVLGLVGANGQAVYVESINGTFRLVNSPWNLQLFSVDQSGNVWANGSFTAGGSASIGGNLQVNGSATVNGNQTIGSNLQVNGSATVNGNTTTWGSSYANGTSTANGNMVTNSFAQVNGLANIGWGCAPDGLLARASDGSGFVQCQGGVWKHIGGYSSVIQITGPGTYTGDSVASCPGGYTLLGGGASGGWANPNNSITGWNGGNFLFGMMSYPSGNSWHASTTSSAAYAVAHAICAQ